MSGRTVNDKTNEVLQRFLKFQRKRVLIGIPADSKERKPEVGEKTAPNNALIGYVMEHGDDEHNIPPRPFLVPGIASVKSEIADRMQKALTAGLSGDMQACDNGLMAVGLIGQAAVQKQIIDGEFTPLSERTIEARARRGRKGAKDYLRLKKQGVPTEVLNDSGVGLVKPLIDSGQLLQAITFIVDKRGS